MDRRHGDEHLGGHPGEHRCRNRQGGWWFTLFTAILGAVTLLGLLRLFRRAWSSAAGVEGLCGLAPSSKRG